MDSQSYYFANQRRHFVELVHHFAEDSLVVRGGAAWQIHPHHSTNFNAHYRQ